MLARHTAFHDACSPMQEHPLSLLCLWVGPPTVGTGLSEPRACVFWSMPPEQQLLLSACRWLSRPLFHFVGQARLHSLASALLGSSTLMLGAISQGQGLLGKPVGGTY